MSELSSDQQLRLRELLSRFKLPTFAAYPSGIASPDDATVPVAA